MRLVRSHAAEWGVDTANVGVMGSSAGGHLATTLATHYHSKATRPDFQILLYPVVTMDKTFTDMGTHDNLIGKDASPEMEELYSNEKHVTDDTPRAFIIFSSNDRTVPLKNGFLYAQAMIDHKIPVSLHVYKKQKRRFKHLKRRFCSLICDFVNKEPTPVTCPVVCLACRSCRIADSCHAANRRGGRSSCHTFCR